MSQDSNDPTSPEVINLILPEGRSVEDYHRLAKAIVGDYTSLSNMESAPAESMPVLNDSTGILTVPTSPTRSVAVVRSRVQSLPEAAGTTIESAPTFRAASKKNR